MGEQDLTDEFASAPAQRRRFRHLGWLVILVVAVGAALIFRLVFVQTFYVPSPSMVPTLLPGDRMLVLKAGYSITRGAIIVFRRPPGDRYETNDEDLVKRVIGLPGETIWSKGNTVYVNGRVLHEPWLPKGEPLGPKPITRQTIPKNDYFVMGDNRPASLDSRWWGYVPRSSVIGRVFLVFWRNGHPVFDVI